MMKPLKSFAPWGIVVVGLFGCDASVDEGAVSQGQALVVVEGGDSCVPLYAGKHTEAGSVCVALKDGLDTSMACGEGATGALAVTYVTTDGWQLMEAHLAVGDHRDDLPVNASGNPVPGRFPYHSGSLVGATEYTFTVPLCTLGLDGAMESCEPKVAYFAAHAVVRHKRHGTETAWADGQQFVARGNWAEYFTRALRCEPTEPPPPPVRCETAWAYSTDALSFCKNDVDGDGRPEARWGWSVQALPGMSTFAIYAHAGQCILGNGTQVGTLVVKYDGQLATVRYELAEGFWLDETHLYLDDVPQTTVEPGKLGLAHEGLDGATVDSYQVELVTDLLYLSAHAVVCGDF